MKKIPGNDEVERDYYYHDPNPDGDNKSMILCYLFWGIIAKMKSTFTHCLPYISVIKPSYIKILCKSVLLACNYTPYC